MHYFFFFFNDTATTEIYTLSLHDALPISAAVFHLGVRQSENGLDGHAWIESDGARMFEGADERGRSEEHTSELQSHLNLVCRLLLEKKKNSERRHYITNHCEATECT